MGSLPKTSPMGCSPKASPKGDLPKAALKADPKGAQPKSFLKVSLAGSSPMPPPMVPPMVSPVPPKGSLPKDALPKVFPKGFLTTARPKVDTPKAIPRGALPKGCPKADLPKSCLKGGHPKDLPQGISKMDSPKGPSPKPFLQDDVPMVLPIPQRVPPMGFCSSDGVQDPKALLHPSDLFLALREEDHCSPNPFDLLRDDEEEEATDDEPPSWGPLVRRLKAIDEKERRALSSVDVGPPFRAQSKSKKKKSPKGKNSS